MSSPPSPQLFRDPWAKREAWRKHPMFARRAMFSKMFPGFGVAVVAFTTYVIVDNVFLQAKGGSHLEVQH
ncbi:NADH-ubiquinone oxidoreductase B12 subunit family-domain-containing protein [Amylocystis lapponica]|nr:NADH-ubiquinone oxidoreductase B12 subunit family-domain-containing protein [Amylocystis lapponica]